MVDQVRANQRSFGVEEEYQLLNTWTGRPENRAAEIITALPELNGRAEREFLASELETATPVCHFAEQAESSLEDFRRRVALAAADQDVVLAGTGLPPVGGDTVASVTPKARYQAIDEAMRSAAAHQYSTGTHVHVEVPSRDVGIEVLARLAPWTPALLALSANSPVWNGEPSGFASWRHIMGLSWPTSGYPPAFHDASEYERVIAQLVDSGILLDSAMLTWTCRLSERYPTVELRIADAQLTAQDSVAFAVIVRALVERCVREWEQGVARPQIHPALLSGSTWLAARDGLQAELPDPLDGRPRSAFSVAERMANFVELELTRFGDSQRVDRYLDRLGETGGPAQVQLDHFADAGVHGLLDLYERGAAETLQDEEPAVIGTLPEIHESGTAETLPQPPRPEMSAG
ncbi:glutamate--cysteine ligase [Rarobacter faecitabidus]|uniref:Putative glutamate--cysteine ligase 2 n=1 Tax=Rarobacter faecitabidus TaxID=13243 RepID=A0A542ZAT3_RARFA|nr:carboxylate-amine ligase [Rarobacter faecitabidus]